MQGAVVLPVGVFIFAPMTPMTPMVPRGSPENAGFPHHGSNCTAQCGCPLAPMHMMTRHTVQLLAVAPPPLSHPTYDREPQATRHGRLLLDP
jgi:hypothetical protein